MDRCRTTLPTNTHGETLDKKPGVSQAIAAVDGAAPTPPGTARMFSRFTAFTAPSRLTLIRPRAAKSGGVRTITTRRPFAAGFDTRPWSSTVAPTANGSAGAAAGTATGAATGAATARGTRVVRLSAASSAGEDPAATLDDLREAVTTLEDVTRIARRTFGGAHPDVAGIEQSLQDTRAALRARETPSPGGSA